MKKMTINCPQKDYDFYTIPFPVKALFGPRRYTIFFLNSKNFILVFQMTAAMTHILESKNQD